MNASDRLRIDFRSLYDHFNAPVTDFDCGERCAPHHPRGVPLCCDICEAVPVAYWQEWDYLKQHTDLWHLYADDECGGSSEDAQFLREETPENMTLVACKGAAHCQREYRSVSCRQFPFFPYISADGRFLGLAYEPSFEQGCWVISNLWSVTLTYRREFVEIYDLLFAVWPDEFDNYAQASAEARELFAERRMRMPLLHRNGNNYLLSPASDRLQLADIRGFRKFGVYAREDSA